jgi:hypothetical protein
VDAYVNILHRLARFLAGVTPEALGSMILVVFEYPDVVLAVVVWVLGWMLSSILGHVFVLVALAFLTVYVWSKLPLWLQCAIQRTAAAFLPNKVAQVLGVMPVREANAEVGMDRPNRTQVPKTWLNSRVEVEFNRYTTDPEEVIQTYGDLVDVNDVGVVIERTYTGRACYPGGRPRKETTFYPWTSIKGMTHQPDTFDNVTDEELDESLGEGDPL